MPGEVLRTVCRLGTGTRGKATVLATLVPTADVEVARRSTFPRAHGSARARGACRGAPTLNGGALALARGAEACPKGVVPRSETSPAVRSARTKEASSKSRHELSPFSAARIVGTVTTARAPCCLGPRAAARGRAVRTTAATSPAGRPGLATLARGRGGSIRPTASRGAGAPSFGGARTRGTPSPVRAARRAPFGAGRAFRTVGSTACV